jgi:hypothetical protein
MTRDVRVGRVLVAALQQAIAEELPTRTEFYDHWLGPDGRRDGTLGQAPMTAVIGFLRTEGAAYDRVVESAGRMVAAWTWTDAGSWARVWVPRLPRWWRARAVCSRIKSVVADTCPATVVKTTVARGVVTVDVKASVFCGAREIPPAPLCGFYSALVMAMFASAGLVVSGQMERCRARAGAHPDSPVEGKQTCVGTFAVSLAP